MSCDVLANSCSTFTTYVLHEFEKATLIYLLQLAYFFVILLSKLVSRIKIKKYVPYTDACEIWTRGSSKLQRSKSAARKAYQRYVGVRMSKSWSIDQLDIDQSTPTSRGLRWINKPEWGPDLTKGESTNMRTRRRTESTDGSEKKLPTTPLRQLT